MEKAESKKKNRIYYFEILRAIACLSVIMVHASAQYAIKDIGSINFWTGNIIDGLVRFGVPVFVMISGALMLDKDYEFSKKKLNKHIVKIIIFFISWSVIYCVYFKVMEPIIRHEEINRMDVIISVIRGKYHLWFCYLIVGLYLIVPLLRLWVKEENVKYVDYFIKLSIIFTFLIPQIIEIGKYYNNFFDYLNEVMENSLKLRYVGGYTTYFILGWYLHNHEIKNKKLINILGILGIVISIFGTYIVSKSTGESVTMYRNLSLNVFYPSISIFLLIKSKFKNKDNKENKIIKTISKNSLGIWAMHVFVITKMDRLLSKAGCEIAIINITVLFVTSFIISYIGSIILSKIPVIKRII